MREQDQSKNTIHISAANLNFASSKRPFTLFWSSDRWSHHLETMGYDGMELHALRTERLLGATAAALTKRGVVTSFHQSFGHSIALPSPEDSLTILDDAQKAAHKRLPIVVYPEATPEAIQHIQTQSDFTEIRAQPYFKLADFAGTRTMPELRDWLAQKEIGVCFDTYHYRRGELNTASPWQEQLPEMAASGELREIHLAIGREALAETQPELARDSMRELQAFIEGPEEALATPAGQMLQTALHNMPEQEVPHVVVETNQQNLLNSLGRTSIVGFHRSAVLVAHHQITSSIRAIANDT